MKEIFENLSNELVKTLQALARTKQKHNKEKLALGKR